VLLARAEAVPALLTVVKYNLRAGDNIPAVWVDGAEQMAQGGPSSLQERAAMFWVKRIAVLWCVGLLWSQPPARRRDISPIFYPRGVC